MAIVSILIIIRIIMNRTARRRIFAASHRTRLSELLVFLVQQIRHVSLKLEELMGGPEIAPEVEIFGDLGGGWQRPY